MSWTDLLFCRHLARLTWRKKLAPARKASIRLLVRTAGACAELRPAGR